MCFEPSGDSFEGLEITLMMLISLVLLSQLNLSSSWDYTESLPHAILQILFRLGCSRNLSFIP